MLLTALPSAEQSPRCYEAAHVSKLLPVRKVSGEREGAGHVALYGEERRWYGSA